jgi:3-oxoacyl-[acyl-carrier-protein] synthase-1
MKSIYLSAPGLVCCAGSNSEELYNSCLKGDRGGFVVQELPGGSASENRVKYPVGQIQMEDQANFAGATFSANVVNSRIIRIIDEALRQIQDEIEKALAGYGPERIGICLGTCDNGSVGSLLAHREFAARGVFPANYSLAFQSPSFLVDYISRKLGVTGPVLTVATACASGASAIVRGAELIRAGFCDAVIAGGADIVSETVLLGFHSLEVLSESLCNPFSKNRKGINLGEGAAFFLLEASPPVDKQENACVELLGAGESSDAFHMTTPGPDGAGPVKAMKAALLNAGLESTQVGYVNLHGTGTELNDKAEALAMRELFGGSPPPASSTKPIMGHTLGAAGALEAALCWMVLAEKRGLPVHCWDGEKDDELPFFHFINDCEALPGHETPSVCMSNSFAFGGCNVSLILGRSQ